ncbi:MAG: tetratricopeptide repeat protein [Planctomycetota bacterium]|nr:tetratricopeptide repeat protein [Planctomycetota bacterium]
MYRGSETLWLGLVFLVCAAWSAGAEEPSFVLRKYDEVITKDRRQFQGEILSEDDGVVRIRVQPSRTVVPLDLSNIETIKRRSTPESEFQRHVTQYKDEPYKLVEIAKVALNYPTLREKVLAMLEEKSASGFAPLLVLLAEQQLANNDPGKALETAQKLLSRKDSGAGYLLVGRSLAAQGKTDEALKALKKAYDLEPENSEVLISLADVYLSLGQPQEAQKVFSDVLEKSPKNLAALIGQGRVRLREGQLPEAALSFSAALQIDGENVPAKIGLAACKALRKEFDEAVKLSEDVLRYENRSAQAYGLEGYALLLKGDPADLPKALDKIEQSLRENPNDPRMVALKAVALDRDAYASQVAGKDAEAGTKRQQAVQLLGDLAAMDPQDDVLQYLLAEMYFRQGDLERAYAGFKRTVQLAPRFAPTHRAVGAVALRMQKWQEAESAYQKAGELDLASGEYQAGRGLALLGMNRLPEAQEALKKARELDSNNVAALCGLGYIMNAEKNESAARALFQQALAADGGCVYAATALKSIFQQRQQNLEYLTFETPPPDTWKSVGGTRVKATVKDGAVRWQGVQGAGDSRMLEFQTQLRTEDFVRLEADIEVPVGSTSSVGLRVGARSGTAVSFEVELGKEPTGQLAYRYRDYSGASVAWKAIQPWPASGRARLGISTEDLASGRVTFHVNGEEVGQLPLKIQDPKRITAGVFAEVPAKEAVDAACDNLALLVRMAEDVSSGPKPGELIPPEKDKP